MLPSSTATNGVMPCKERCSNAGQFGPRSTHGSSFSATGITCLRRSGPVQSSFHPMPIACGAPLRSGNETHVSHHHAPGQGASNIRDADGVTAANPGFAQEGSDHATIATLNCILLDALLHWTHSARLESTGEAWLYHWYVVVAFDKGLRPLWQQTICNWQPFGRACFDDSGTSTKTTTQEGHWLLLKPNYGNITYTQPTRNIRSNTHWTQHNRGIRG